MYERSYATPSREKDKGIAAKQLKKTVIFFDC
jgi:hypothetical protein